MASFFQHPLTELFFKMHSFLSSIFLPMWGPPSTTTQGVPHRSITTPVVASRAAHQDPGTSIPAHGGVILPAPHPAP